MIDTQIRTNKLLEVKHLSVDYESARGAVHAVTDVSFAIERGQILGLAGESGSGKSTLAYAIARLLQPPAVVTQGQVLYYPHSAAPTIHDMSQQAKPVYGRGDPCGRPGVVDVLALNPAQLRAFRWHDLSIVFQSAMNALNPVLDIEVQIMDEPTTALDVVVQRDILAQIMRLRNDFGFSVIFITHDLSLLLEIADTIGIMYAGSIVEMATQENLYRHPRHPSTHGLLNSFPSLRGPRRRRVSIPGSPPDLRSVPPGCAFHPRCAFSFAACHTIQPALFHVPCEGAKGCIEAPPVDSVSAGKRVTHVACHLYDATLNPEGPPESLESENVNQHCNVNQ